MAKVKFKPYDPQRCTKCGDDNPWGGKRSILFVPTFTPEPTEFVPNPVTIPASLIVHCGTCGNLVASYDPMDAV